MGYLKHDAYAVSGEALRVLAGAMLQLFYDFQGIVHRLMGFYPPNAHDGADTAGVMLVFRPVKRIVPLPHLLVPSSRYLSAGRLAAQNQAGRINHFGARVHALFLQETVGLLLGHAVAVH
ncbi:hypothetical protein SDC9_84885 [bioreactor metagenome]|uniref:Uncharacterized protein n=1 Tax=bioreactor metagenome TaxID=1076179 RepID=A0A644ZBK2_9ZZZZ